MTGSRLLLELALAGKSITALRRKGSSLKLIKFIFRDALNLLNKIQWVEGDVTDASALHEMIESGMEVYHAAGLVSFDPSDRELLYQVNICGTENVVNACIENKVRKLVYVGSVASLGRSESIYIDENSHWESNKHSSDYAISKYGGEREVWRGIAEGLNGVIVNPSVIIGAGLSSNGSSALIQKVDNGLLFYTNGSSGFVDARDIAKAMIALMNSDISGERFILSAENSSYVDLFKMIASALKKKPPAIRATRSMAKLYITAEFLKSKILRYKPLVTKFSAESAFSNYRYSNDKITRALDFSFTPLKETVENACREYRELTLEKR